MEYKFELIEQELQHAVSIRTRSAVGDLPKVIGNAYGVIIKYLSELGKEPSGAPFVAYYNMDMQDLDIEIGFPVCESIAGKNEVEKSEIKGGKYITCMHIGPYNKIEPAYTALINWASENGYILNEMAYEFYLNCPTEVPESELQTRIVFPLK